MSHLTLERYTIEVLRQENFSQIFISILIYFQLNFYNFEI